MNSCSNSTNKSNMCCWAFGFQVLETQLMFLHFVTAASFSFQLLQCPSGPARLRAVGAQRSREGLRRFVPSGAGLLPSAQLQHPQLARSGDGGGRGGGRQEEGRAGERQAGRGGCEERRLGTSAHALCHRSPAAAGVSPLGPGG